MGTTDTKTFQEQVIEITRGALIWCSVLSAVLLATIVLATWGFANSLGASNRSLAVARHVSAERIQSKYDSCGLLKQIVYKATPPDQASQNRAKAFIKKTPLKDCTTYSRTP